jgi:hypothetical protein
MTTITNEPLHTAAINLHINMGKDHPGVSIMTDGNTTTITPLGVATPAPAPTPAVDAATKSSVIDAQVEDMLSRQEAYYDDTRAREMFAHLVSEGWEPVEYKARGKNPGLKKPRYILLTYKGAKKKITGYLHSDEVKFVRDRDVAKKLPGAHHQKSYTGFPFNGDDFDTAVKALAAMKAYADGK